VPGQLADGEALQVVHGTGLPCRRTSILRLDVTGRHCHLATLRDVPSLWSEVLFLSYQSAGSALSHRSTGSELSSQSDHALRGRRADGAVFALVVDAVVLLTLAAIGLRRAGRSR
jgi:hypothetical protein